MTRLLQCGWETGDVNQLGSPLAVGSSFPLPAVVSATPPPRSGTYCLKCLTGNGASTSWSNASRQIIFHASKTELYYAFGFYRSGTESSAAPSHVVFATTDTAGNVNNALTVEDDGSVRAYYINGAGASPGTGQFVLIGTSATVVPNTTWVHFEVHIVAATGATGTYEVKLNGATVISATSQRTAQSNANLGSLILQFVRMQTVGNSGTFKAFDDLRVNDTSGSLNNTWCGDESILMLTPNAAGDSAQFSRGGADSGTNYTQVDELPPNALTDYVYDSTVGHLDLYNLSTVTVVSVSAVEVLMQAFNVDGSGGSVNVVTKTAAGQSDGAAQTVVGSPLYLKRLLETDPADSAAWTQAKINALQVGPKIAS